MPNGDHAKRVDKAKQSEKEQLQSERTRSLREAGKKGTEAGKTLGETLQVRKESKAVHVGIGVAEVAMKFGADLLKTAGAAGGALGLELGGFVLGSGYDVMKSLDDLMETNKNLLRLDGRQFALNTVWQDSAAPSNKHITEGLPYTYGEMKENTWGRWSEHMQLREFAVHWVEVADPHAELAKGYKDVADRANKCIRDHKTPEDRKEALGKMVENGQKAIAETRSTVAMELAKKH